MNNENIVNENNERIGVVLPEYGEYITAANPVLIREMVAELRQMEMEIRGLKHDKKILEEATEKGAKDNLELRGRLNQMEKETDWLAEQKACKEIKNGCCCGHDRQYWREVARKAVINE